MWFKAFSIFINTLSDRLAISDPAFFLNNLTWSQQLFFNDVATDWLWLDRHDIKSYIECRAWAVSKDKTEIVIVYLPYGHDYI